MKNMNVYVTKRNGKLEPVNFDKIVERITQQTVGLDANYVKPFIIAQKVIEGITDNIQTRTLDVLAQETAASLTSKHPDYALLAARLAITALYKETKKSFSATVLDLYNYVNPKNNTHSPIVASWFNDIVQANSGELDAAIVKSRDKNFDYFGYKTLEKSYLLKINGKIVETPQFMYMRTAIQIWRDNIEQVIKTYNILSEGYYTHATPTLYNSGTIRPQLSSCFLLSVEDSIEDIYDNIKDCAIISKNAGGIGIAFSNIRSAGSYIAGTNGDSKGTIPFIKVYNETARAVDQGGNKRKGAFCLYLEPWHADIFDILDLKKNQGKEEIRARDLFYAMWMCDLFMERVDNDDNWTLMCPNECKGLTDVYGEEFETLYKSYEAQGKGRKVIKARSLWNKILESQMETGVPYIAYKDSVNRKSNQKNLGIIKSSNLCIEILERTGISTPQKEILQNKALLDSLGLGEFYGLEKVNEHAVCNLASIALPKYINKKKYDFNKLYDITYLVTINLNNVIDTNYYPTKEAKFSNLLHRPIGIGVQGLADTFAIMGYAFDSPEAAQLNKNIFETMYYAFLRASCDLAKKDGAYTTFKGSPASEGILQFDMWGVKPSMKWDWDGLKKDIVESGLRNSLGMANMPTASTSNILGNNECFEPFTSNLYSRGVSSGSFTIVNKHLVKDLIALNLWTNEVREKIISEGGSIQNIPEIPTHIKELYKTNWEIKQRVVLDLAAERGAFIDQTQSLNIFLAVPTYENLTSMHFYGWGKRSFGKDSNGNPIIPEDENTQIYYDKNGNPKFYRSEKTNQKTGMYYLRRKTEAEAVKITQQKTEAEKEAALVCSLDNPEDCEACGA